MKILCLGAGGFIGSHLTKRLLSDGHTVTAVDLYDD
ncbi:MAG: NAD-dependent epimerase/dehydratase family protein, partial [bacterium]|nr:NAD-dependent epimerase/dehydratase family protein [bacterium]